MASQSDVPQSEALQSEALPSQANSPPPTQRVEGTPPTPPPSQVSPTRLEQVYDDIEEAGAEEWAALRLRVTGSADPGAGAKDRLLAKVKELLPEVPSGTTDTLAAFLKNCTVERREAFFRKWARSVYDTEAVEQEWDLRKKPPAQTLKEFFHKHCQEVYASFLKDNATLNPLQSQRETALKALAPAELGLQLVKGCLWAQDCQKMATWSMHACKDRPSSSFQGKMENCKYMQWKNLRASGI